MALVKTKINYSNLKQSINLSNNKHTMQFNCWGATLYILGRIDNLQWVSCTDITEFLDIESDQIIFDDLKEGDILSLYANADGFSDIKGKLIHTAVYMGNGLYWHKMGGENGEYNKLENILKTYNTTDYKYLRLI